MPPGELAELLADRGDLDGLRARADAGDGWPPGGWPGCWPAAATWTSCAPGPTPATRAPPWQLAELLDDRGDLDEAIQVLRPHADTGDAAVAYLLARLLESAAT